MKERKYTHTIHNNLNVLTDTLVSRVQPPTRVDRVQLVICVLYIGPLVFVKFRYDPKLRNIIL